MSKPGKPHRLQYTRDAGSFEGGKAETVEVWTKGGPTGWPKSWGTITIKAPVIDASLGLSHMRTAILSIRGGRVVEIEWMQEQDARICEGQAALVLEDCRIPYVAPELPEPKNNPAIADRVAPRDRKRSLPPQQNPIPERP